MELRKEQESDAVAKKEYLENQVQMFDVDDMEIGQVK
jgi:hypothetical protein